MNINERIQKILASLEHTREDLLALSDDIWSNIDHNSDEALEAGTEFKRSYNSAMNAFADVAQNIQTLVENYASAHITPVVAFSREEERRVVPLDTTTRYPLAENFSYTRPIGYELDGEVVSGLTSWRQLYQTFCQHLARLHPNFHELANSDHFLTSRNNRYFATSPQGLRVYAEIIPGVFAEVHFSANNFRDRILELLSFFGHNPEQMFFFLREDRDA